MKDKCKYKELNNTDKYRVSRRHLVAEVKKLSLVCKRQRSELHSERLYCLSCFFICLLCFCCSSVKAKAHTGHPIKACHGYFFSP